VRDALRERAWDLVLCDHRMPRFDAPRALALVHEAKLEVPFVLVSGRIGEAAVVALMKAGVSDYVHKDSLAELATVIGRVLDEHRTASEHKRAQQALELFADASAMIAYALDPDAIVRELAKLVVKHLADSCVVEVSLDDRAVITASVGQAGDHALDVPLASNHVAGSIHMLRGTRFDDIDDRIARELAARITSVLDNACLLHQARMARAAAETANRLKDEFLAITSHELRTPMTSILGFTRLLLAGQIPDDRRVRALEVIDRNTLVLARILDDLLDYARISSGRLQLGLVPVSLAVIAESAIEAIQPTAEAKRIRIASTMVDAATRVRGDQLRLQQVVTILLANAIRFTANDGHVNVAVLRRGEHVELRVSDTGDGIDAAFLPFVFERFRQGDTGHARRHGGLGLGLAIAKHLVELHDGIIEAHSPGPGCGATFVVRLPAVHADLAVVPTAEAIDPPASLDGLRILVVDDDASSRDLLDGILGLHGGSVVVAANVTEALDAFVEAPPDLMVSDLSMPGGTGYDLVRHIRRLPATRGGQVPAIALSALTRDEDRVAALDAGFDRFLAKPIDPHELVGVISQVVAIRSA
jgi:signal transduction histidine kinase/DNA-binding response OmpR family regulator